MSDEPGSMSDDDEGTDDESDDAPEDAEDSQEADPTPAPGERWLSYLPTMALLALAVAVMAVAFFVWQERNDLAAADDDRQAAARVAGDFATAVLSYDYQDLDGSLDDVLGLSTPDWGRQYEDAWFSDQQPVIEELQAVAEVDVRDVMLGDAQDGVLPAVVVFNATIRSDIGTRRLGGSYLRLDLTEVDGEWRVDDMAFLASTEQSLDPATGEGGGTPTPTTAPPAGG
jgi:Mce-associated membrane protein